MLDEKETDVEVINDEPEVQDAPSNITVDLENKEPAQKQAEQPKPEAKNPADNRLANTVAYQTRQLQKALQELQQTKTEIAALRERKNVQAPQTQDEIDEIAQKDWKLGVKKVMEKEIEDKVQDILKKRDEALAETQRKASQESELDKSKQRVISKYPEIEDGSSEESALYRQVISEDNSLLSNVHGPEIAMYRMEERMRAMGKIPPSTQPLIDREALRVARAGASSIIGRQASKNGKITLTKEQKEFCDHYKIPYEQYAKNLKSQNFREGVEV